MEPPPEPFRWPQTRGVLQPWLLRRYADWLFPQLRVTWEARDVFTFQPGPRKSPEVPEYRFPRSRGICRMSDLRHFGEFAIEQTRPLVLPILVDVRFEPIFRQEIQGEIQVKEDKEHYTWRRGSVLAFVTDLRQLDAYLAPRLAARRKREWDFSRLTV